jgi:hypothetical protein
MRDGTIPLLVHSIRSGDVADAKFPGQTGGGIPPSPTIESADQVNTLAYFFPIVSQTTHKVYPQSDPKVRTSVPA